MDVLLALSAGAPHGTEVVPTLLLALAFVLVAAKLAGELFERLGQPSVLGELLVGILLGNLTLAGGPDLASLAANETFMIRPSWGPSAALPRRARVHAPRDDGGRGRATLVAVVGVLTPMALGSVASCSGPGVVDAHAFLGACSPQRAGDHGEGPEGRRRASKRSRGSSWARP